MGATPSVAATRVADIHHPQIVTAVSAQTSAIQSRFLSALDGARVCFGRVVNDITSGSISLALLDYANRHIPAPSLLICARFK
jgi:hypothetical protein